MKVFYVVIRILIFFIFLSFVACSSTRELKDNQYLLVKNKVSILNPGKGVSTSDLEGLIQQKPNKRFLGVIPFKLWFHSAFKKIGEPPVILDKSLMLESREQMQKYLNNLGYFNSTIEDSIFYRKKKAKIVNYIITLAEPYRIRNIDLGIADSSIYNIVQGNSNNSLIKTEKIFNSYILDKERERITSLLLDRGYFGFSKDYIYYEVDSSLNSKQIDVTILIKNAIAQGTAPDQVPVKVPHKVYYINNVSIHPDFKPYRKNSIEFDTIVKKLARRNDPDPDYYDFIYVKPLKIKPRVITRSLFIESNNKYNATDARQSYKKLNSLAIHRYTNINFKESTDTTLNPEKNYLDCTIQLTRNPPHSYSIEAQGTNSGGDLGVGGYFIYRNKNLFRGAEVFDIKLKGALEAQSSGTTPEGPENNKFLFFNTFEAGIEANLYIPKFLAPINQDVFSRYFRPKTTINLGYNMQDRLDYDRIITNVSFGYEWLETKFKTHILFPIDINVVKVNTTPHFDSILAKESERFRNQYTDHLILALKYSYIFNNQEINKIKNFFYFRGNIETSGNLLNLAAKAADAPENSENYRTIFGIRYSQYIKSDFDFRYYIMSGKKHSFAFRYFMGLAIPYGNSSDIPFEKGFYGGGANGMKAWPLRYLGPGSYQNLNPGLERVGDIMLEGNIEYRFPIYRVIKGGLFYDIGNIWLLDKIETFPGGEFAASSFLSELAMDIGFGIRLDFSYFIFRVDIAQRIKDPALPKNDRWVVGREARWLKPVMNFGIGYPF